MAPADNRRAPQLDRDSCYTAALQKKLGVSLGSSSSSSTSPSPSPSASHSHQPAPSLHPREVCHVPTAATMALLSPAADAPRPRMRMMVLNKRFSRIAVAALVFAGALALLLWRGHSVSGLLPRGLRRRPVPDTYQFNTTSSFFPVALNPQGKTADDLCATFPRHLLEFVQPVLKMGHGEKRDKVEAQLDSVSACFARDDLLIFSDVDETIRDHDVIDILADLPASYYEENPDFANYVLQREMRDKGTLDKDEAATKRINGWILDKYKFIPMVERAWMTKPNKAFYFFYETDTYVVWDNVFRFLQTFDPDMPLYMGSPSPGRHDEKTDIKTWFANGGPGFVLSRGAIKKLLHRDVAPSGQYIDPPLTEKWLPLLRHECCGDSVMGWTLWNVSVPLQGYWPLFNPHPLHGIPYSDLYWCQPVLTLHKTSPEDMVQVWKWEFGQRQRGRPMLYSDLYNFHHPGDRGIVDDWDNGDWDSWSVPDEAGINTFEACRDHCKQQDQCVQWSWRGRDAQQCVLMRSIRYGQARRAEPLPWPEERDDKGDVIPPPADRKDRWVDYKAGWVGDRIERWRREHRCEAVQWVGPSITRIF